MLIYMYICPTKEFEPAIQTVEVCMLFDPATTVMHMHSNTNGISWRTVPPSRFLTVT
jgi:hypothetical protein